MRSISDESLKILKNKQINIKEFGQLLNEQWKLKKYLNNSSTNSQINRIYKIAIENGAYGGKVCGAGAGGFLMLIAPPFKHKIIKLKLSKYLFVPIRFESTGSKIVYFSHS
tara:strand:+ start:228 stop:560 length:333 start_codon:yes stop_codon:yes gene_type:complete